LDAIPEDVARRAKLLVLNYPNSPTGRVATREFYQRVIEFARAKQIVVVQDAAHILLTFDGEPLSFLSIPGAREVGVEVHSLSKGFDMIGWRMGWVCGHERLVQAFADVKDNCDSGQFIAIQKAAVTALDDPRFPSGCAANIGGAWRSWSPPCPRAAFVAACRAVRTSCTRRHRGASKADRSSPAPRRPAST
jgi:LL-diaminopimelate aminotransferase